MPQTIPGFPSGYTASFGGLGFDVRTNGYSSKVEGNRTVRAVPWANTYNVVIQYGGLQPLTRRYRALVYSEADFLALALLVNNTALLQTPREPTPTLASLDSIEREDTDPNTPDGQTAIMLNFTMVQ